MKNNKNTNIKSRGWIKFGSWVIAAIMLVFMVKWLIYIDSKTTCGNYYSEGKNRGAEGFVYHYSVDGVDYKAATAAMSMKIQSLEELKKIKCIEVEYSVWFPSVSRVVDERIIK